VGFEVEIGTFGGETVGDLVLNVQVEAHWGEEVDKSAKASNVFAFVREMQRVLRGELQSQQVTEREGGADIEPEPLVMEYHIE
jgi:hypothetical protein